MIFKGENSWWHDYIKYAINITLYWDSCLVIINVVTVIVDILLLLLLLIKNNNNNDDDDNDDQDSKFSLSDSTPPRRKSACDGIVVTSHNELSHAGQSGADRSIGPWTRSDSTARRPRHHRMERLLCSVTVSHVSVISLTVFSLASL